MGLQDEADGFYDALTKTSMFPSQDPVCNQGFMLTPAVVDSEFATHVTDFKATADKSFTSTMDSYGC